MILPSVANHSLNNYNRSRLNSKSNNIDKIKTFSPQLQQEQRSKRRYHQQQPEQQQQPNGECSQHISANNYNNNNYESLYEANNEYGARGYRNVSFYYSDDETNSYQYIEPMRFDQWKEFILNRRVSEVSSAPTLAFATEWLV